LEKIAMPRRRPFALDPEIADYLDAQAEADAAASAAAAGQRRRDHRHWQLMRCWEWVNRPGWKKGRRQRVADEQAAALGRNTPETDRVVREAFAARLAVLGRLLAGSDGAAARWRAMARTPVERGLVDVALKGHRAMVTRFVEEAKAKRAEVLGDFLNWLGRCEVDWRRPPADGPKPPPPVARDAAPELYSNVPPAGDLELSSPQPARVWAKVFRMNRNRAVAFLKSGRVRAKQLSERSWQVAIADIPATDQQKYRENRAPARGGNAT
jgi:hypothetical protein